MGAVEAFAKLGVPPVPPTKTTGGTAKTVAAVGCSPCSTSSPEKGREPDAEPLSPEQRRAWSDDLCRRLHADVAHQSSPGLGHWPPAWHMVEAPSARLLDLLAVWEDTGDVADQRAAEQAADAVLYAWEHAARRWEQEIEGFERWCIEHEDDADSTTPEQWRKL